jgi:SAM-dependent methyltransferase
VSWVVDAFGEWYPTVYPHRNEAEAAQLAARIDETVGLSRKRVLDIGCGAGRHLAEFAGRGAAPVGLDLSPALLNEARRVRSEAGAVWPLVRGDMRRLPFVDGAFDGAMSLFTSFGYFSDLDDRTQLREAARVVLPGGFHVLDFLNRDHVLAHPNPASTRVSGPHRIDERREFVEGNRRVVKTVRIRSIQGDELLAEYQERVTLYTEDELRDRLTRVGFRVIREWGDYAGGSFDRAVSARHVFVSVRE